MSYSTGLVRLLCSGCGNTSFVKLQPLLTASSVPCPRCQRMASAAEVEAGSPGAARLLGIMRQLAQARERHREREATLEPAVTAGAPGPSAAMPTDGSSSVG